MVMQWIVNPPSSGTTGSIPVFSTKQAIVVLGEGSGLSIRIRWVRVPSMAPIFRMLPATFFNFNPNQWSGSIPASSVMAAHRSTSKKSILLFLGTVAEWPKAAGC